MVSVFQETWNEGEAKGIIEMGHDFGLSEEDILARLQKKLNVCLLYTSPSPRDTR